MRVQWQWPGVVVFGLVFVTLGLLVWQGKVPPDLLGVILAWLIPSPMAHRDPAKILVARGVSDENRH